jgi:outer membrane protein assembly factor BamB
MGQTPAYHDGRVFFVGSTQTIYALDAKTGNVLWHIEDTWWQDRLDLAIASERIIYQTRGVGKQDRSHGESPIVIDGKLVVNRNGNLIALNPVDGKELWRVKKSLHKNASAHRWTHQGKDYILAYGSDMLRCLDPENGNQLWEAPFYRSSPGFSGATIVVHYSAILDNGHEKGFADDVFRVQRLSLEGPQELWSVPLVQSDDENVRYSEYCAPLILGDKVFISGWPMTSVYDLQTGERLQRFDFPSVVNAGHFQGVEDRILAQPDGKHGIVRLVPLKNSGDTVTHLPASGVDLNASPNGFWAGPHPHTTTYGPYNRHPIVDGRIFIKGNDAIYCYDLRDRKK